MKSSCLTLQLLPLHGGDPFDDSLVVLDLAENSHLRAGTLVGGFRSFQNPCLKMFVDRTQFFKATLGNEGSGSSVAIA